MAKLTGIIQQLEKQRSDVQREVIRLDAAISALRGMNGATRGIGAIKLPTRRISAAGRRRIAEAQRQRWARLRQLKAKKAA
jgi:hypothetical protein